MCSGQSVAIAFPAFAPIDVLSGIGHHETEASSSMGQTGMTLLILALVLLSFHGFIHWGLRPTRVLEAKTPENVGLDYEAHCLSTVRGKQLSAWFVPPSGQARAPAVLLMHGWGGNMETMLPLAAPLHSAGYGVLLLDARCHGGSDGDSFSSMPRFAEDLESGLDWLQHRQEVDTGRLAVIGHSVGAAAALLAASRRSDVSAVISIAAFSHPASVMGSMFAARHIPMFPVGSYVLRYVQWVIGYSFDAIAPLHTITKVTCPVLLVHGTDDQMVPVSDAETLQARRAGLPGHLLKVAGSHDSYDEMDQRLPELIRFLNEALGWCKA